MKILRQDAWTKEEDAILAESTLKHIREGSTQLVAFEEVGEKLTRTPAACGFRWNSLIRKQYSSEIAEAKKDRKERYKQKRKLQNTQKDSLAYSVTIEHNNDRNQLSMEKVIEYLKHFQTTNPLIQNLENENKTLVKKVTELKRENGQLKEKLENIKNEYDAVTLDYKSLLQIMDRARKLVEVPR